MSASDDSLGNSCDNPNRSGGDNPPFRQDTSDMHNSTVSQDNTTTNGAAPGNSRTRRANLRDDANGDDNSGFATSDFPPLPTHSNYPLFAEVRRLKEALQTENRKVAALEEELAAIKRWLGQAPAEVMALVSSEATKNQAVADGATSDAGGSADTGGRAGSASHERFRQRTGNPRSSFFTNSRVDLNYNYRTNPGQDTGGNGRDGSGVAAATRLRNVGAGGAQGRLDLPGEQDDRSGGVKHGSGLIATIDYSVSSLSDGRGRRGRGARGRGSSSETGRPRYVLNAADYGNPFPGPNTAAGGGWDDAGGQSNLGDW